MVTMEIQGFEEMCERMAVLAAAIREKLVADAVRAGANVIAKAERAAAPVLTEKNVGSDSLEPGALRRDLRARTKIDQDGFAVSIIGPSAKTEYVARFLEYGHRLVKGGSHNSGHEIGFVEPHAFLRQAFEATEAEAVEKFKATMREGIEKELK